MTQSLIEIARGRTGNLPPSMLVRHAERIAGADPSRQRTVLGALLAMIARTDESQVRIGERPSGDRVLGVYRTMLPDGAPTGVSVQLSGIDPLVVSSDSPEYLQGALGLCEHIVAVLFDLCSEYRRVRDGLDQQDRAALHDGDSIPRVTWSPVLDAEDSTDWLRSVRVHGIRVAATAFEENKDGVSGADGVAPRGLTAGTLRLLARWFQPTDDAELCWRPNDCAIDDAHDRLEIVQVLVAIVGLQLPLDVVLARLLDEELMSISRRLHAVSVRDRLVEGLSTFGQTGCKIEPEMVQAVHEHERAFLIHDDSQGEAARVQALAVIHCLMEGAGVRRGVVWTTPERAASWRDAWRDVMKTGLVQAGPTARAGGSGDRSFLLVTGEDPQRAAACARDHDPDLVLLDDPLALASSPGNLDFASLGARFRLALTPAGSIAHMADITPTMRWIDPRSPEPSWDSRMGGGELLAARLAARAVYLRGVHVPTAESATGAEKECVTHAHELEAIPAGALSCSRWADPADSDHLLKTAGASRRSLGPATFLYD